MKILPTSIRLFLILALFSIALQSPAQDSVTIPRRDYEQLKRDAAELKQLKEEVQRLRTELTKLRKSPAETQPTRGVPAPSYSAPTRVPTAPTSTSPRELPPMKVGGVLDVSEVIRDFALNSPAATQRYDRSGLKLRGAITAFDKPSLRRDFEIVFRTAEGQLVCRVAPPAKYTAIYTTRSGSVLTGRTERGAETDLLTVGDVVTIEGNCQGIKDGSILFMRCRLVDGD